MSKKTIFSVLVILLLVGTNAIASNDWLQTNTSNDWFTASNWSLNEVPSQTNITNVRTFQTHMGAPIIINSGDAEAYQLEIGGDNDVWVDDASKTKQSITLNGGTITTTDYFRVGASSTSNRWGEFFMYDGTTVNVGDYMAVPRGNTSTNTHGYAYIYGGTINVTNELYVCHGGASSGLLDISGGTINVGGPLIMRNGGTILLPGAPYNNDPPTTELNITGTGKLVLAGNQVASPAPANSFLPATRSQRFRATETTAGFSAAKRNFSMNGLITVPAQTRQFWQYQNQQQSACLALELWALSGASK
jgi:hypothetical protein